MSPTPHRTGRCGVGLRAPEEPAAPSECAGAQCHLPHSLWHLGVSWRPWGLSPCLWAPGPSLPATLAEPTGPPGSGVGSSAQSLAAPVFLTGGSVVGLACKVQGLGVCAEPPLRESCREPLLETPHPVPHPSVLWSPGKTFGSWAWVLPPLHPWVWLQGSATFCILGPWVRRWEGLGSPAHPAQAPHACARGFST